MRYKFIFNCEYIVYSQYTHSCTQYTATHCNALHHTATHCNTLQHTATNCTTLQHTTTHYTLCIHNILTVVHNINTQYYSWMSHVTYVRIMSHMNIHCVTYTHIWDINLYLITFMNESRHLCMNHFTHEWVMSFIIIQIYISSVSIRMNAHLYLIWEGCLFSMSAHVRNDSSMCDMTHA